MTPTAVFDRLIPLLILFATVLFMLQEPVQRMIKTNGQGALGIEDLADRRDAVSVPGRDLRRLLRRGHRHPDAGALGFLGLGDIHQMNGVKNFLAARDQRRRGARISSGTAWCRGRTRS